MVKKIKVWVELSGEDIVTVPEWVRTEEDLEKFADEYANRREIPDDIVSIIEKVKDKFDQLYVVFTDYTGKVERQIEKERREKDPILFGTFQNQSNRTVIDRFYYIGDWEDEYCDLTLDKMVNETEKVGMRNITKTISTPKDIVELKEQLDSLESKNNTYIVTNKIKKKNVFTNIKSFLTRRK